ncbi:MAG TPA: hypothetical protein VGY55_22255 [Pirellulales bacterium]|nr:hypothetical protein [Pirellulales bacterium]
MDDAKINAAVKYLTHEAIRSTNPLGELMVLLEKLDETRWSKKEIHRIKTSCWRILGAAYGVEPPETLATKTTNDPKDPPKDSAD